MTEGYDAEARAKEHLQWEVPLGEDPCVSLAETLTAAHGVGVKSRDAAILELASEASDAEGRCREQAKTERDLQRPMAAEYKEGKADVFGWAARQLKRLLDA